MKGTKRYFLISSNILWIMWIYDPKWTCKVQAMERKIDAKAFLLKETKFQAQVHLLRGETREVGESKLTQWIYRAYEKGDSTKQG